MFSESESALFAKCAQTHEEFVVIFKKLLVAYLHAYIWYIYIHIWHENRTIIIRLKNNDNNNNVYESGTEDLCTDLCLFTLYIQLYRKLCIHIYIVLERVLDMGDELQNTGNNSCVSCLGWRWHGGKNVFMPRCSSAHLEHFRHSVCLCK